jgi:hypothetical protein
VRLRGEVTVLERVVGSPVQGERTTAAPGEAPGEASRAARAASAERHQSEPEEAARLPAEEERERLYHVRLDELVRAAPEDRAGTERLSDAVAEYFVAPGTRARWRWRTRPALPACAGSSSAGWREGIPRRRASSSSAPSPRRCPRLPSSPGRGISRWCTSPPPGTACRRWSPEGHWSRNTAANPGRRRQARRIMPALWQWSWRVALADATGDVEGDGLMICPSSMLGVLT